MGGNWQSLWKLDTTLQRKEVKHMKENPEVQLEVEELEQRIAPSSANFPPGQFPSGNPAQAPGNSNPNEHPGDHP
jgi:hypothetical protein